MPNIKTSGIVNALNCIVEALRKLAISSVPAGGTIGQVLSKNSDTAFDVKWSTPTDGVSEWSATSVQPTLQSSDDPNYVLRFAANMTAILSVGKKIKYTQHGSVKYGIVVAVGAYTGGNTDVTVFHGTDYDAENTGTYAITLLNYSCALTPIGFPMNPDKWSVIFATSTTYQTQDSPTSDIWYNALSGAIPIGLWNIKLKVVSGAYRGTAGYCGQKITLSTANNSESDSGFTSGANPGNMVQMFYIHAVEKVLELAAKTTYYLNFCTVSSSISWVGIRGEVGTTICKAVCAYL
jgi:hypothetical protein